MEVAQKEAKDLAELLGPCVEACCHYGHCSVAGAGGLAGGRRSGGGVLVRGAAGEGGPTWPQAGACYEPGAWPEGTGCQPSPPWWGGPPDAEPLCSPPAPCG